MRIREATRDDAEAIREVHAASIRELGTEVYSQEQADAWAQGCESADYITPIESDDLEFIVIERDDSALGFGSLKLTSPGDYEATVDGEITGVYIHPSVARQGVGTRILTELERRARTSGIEVLGLSASLNAVPFYNAHGYTHVRKYTHELSSHESTDVTGAIVEMKKEL